MKLALHFVPHMKLDGWSLFFTHKNKIIGTHRICMATYAWMKKVCYCLFPDELFMDWSVWFHQNVGNWTYFLFKKQESSTFRGLSLLLLRYINNYSMIISLQSFLCSSCHLWLLLFDMIFFFPEALCIPSMIARWYYAYSITYMDKNVIYYLFGLVLVFIDGTPSDAMRSFLGIIWICVLKYLTREKDFWRGTNVVPSAECN